MHPVYEVVIGLEVHAQLQTESKLFCGDETFFGADPNTHVSAITLGHPGTLPFLNHKAIEHALRLGIACDSGIGRQGYFARKNYFYPDLPKGYQISQHLDPICSGGRIQIRVGNVKREIRLTRIHLEEDAGKSIHDLETDRTCLDYNRAGTPLVEIVTEPDLRSADEAFAFLTEIRRLVRWIGVCDGNMEEGSLRCDANISIRPHGETKLGTRVEVKNLNSVRNVKKAIEVEVNRLVSVVGSGGKVRQETRSFNADDDSTFSIRSKEDAEDYRYFPEPDLSPYLFTESYLEELRSGLPVLPEALTEDLIIRLGLSEYDARQLCDEKELADYFLESLPADKYAKSLCNWLLGPVRSFINEEGADWRNVPIRRDRWEELLSLVEEGRMSFSAASHRILPVLMSGTDESPVKIAERLDLLQDADTGDILSWVEQVLGSMPEKVIQYRKGKKALIGLFMGEVKKLSRGKADPKRTNEILLDKLNQSK
jgi:aspartyl-tRNA(Asn)/glutamyl-tRNA(Gln) amidotransferase subunit B